ncbi:MAG: hypothetical protein GYA62_13400 [Bacteroidales bacterium]|nr:hypothetical protein [Bacteroidales bacterium]
MAIIRPIGKNTSLASFQKETTEGVFVNPTKEYPFKSCDLKKTMKTEEDTSNIGEVFTTDLITTGYDITGNVEMNVYPNNIAEILFFTLGKEAISNAISGFLFLKYIGNGEVCRVKTDTGALITEVHNGTSWVEDLNLTLSNYSNLSDLVSAINIAGGYIANYWGTGDPTEISITQTNIKNENDSITFFTYLTSNTTKAKNHNIYASNLASDGIPSFSILLDKNLGSSKCFGYSGCKINTLSLSLAVKTFVTASLSLRAKEELTNQSWNATDFILKQPFVTNNVKLYVNGYVFSDIKDLKIDINNNMYIDEAVGLNTFNSQDRQGATINISGTANLTFEENNKQTTYILNQKYERNEPIDLIIIGETTLNYDTNIKAMFFIYLPKIKLSDGTISIGGAERLSLSFAGQVVKNSLYSKHIDIFINNDILTNY